MNNKGQAALEYLMTYGWALIVIAIVVGVLIFIVSSPTSGVVCSSSDPAKILFKSSNIPVATATDPVVARVINIQNATGGALSGVTITAQSGNFGMGAGVLDPQLNIASTLADPGVPAVVSGGNLYLFPAFTAVGLPTSVGASVLGSYTLSYKDQFDYNKTVVITCQGKIA